MSGKAYGKTLPYGFRGAVSRQPDTLIQSDTNVGNPAIQFGAPVVFDATNKGVRALKSTDETASDIIGIAVRRIGQPYADSEDGWYYKKGDVVDVLVRGSIAVELKATTGIAPRGQVYADPESWTRLIRSDEMTPAHLSSLPGGWLLKTVCVLATKMEIHLLLSTVTILRTSHSTL